MTTQDLKSRLIFYNPWWQEKKVPSSLALPFKRNVFSNLIKYLDLERIIILKGPRRTGKSTLIYQLIDNLISKKVDPTKLLYLNFEDPLLRENLHKIIALYESIFSLDIEKDENVYIFLDEAQLLSNWAESVKAFFDKKYPIKFICSGSSASLIQKTGESLAGRTIEEIILPFSFREWVYYKMSRFGTAEKITQSNYLLHQKDIYLLWESYLKRGGFAHILDQNDMEILKKLVYEDVIQKVIFKDLVDLYGIREPAVLEKVFYYLAKSSGQILNTSSLSQVLGVNRQTLSSYLFFLKQAYLYFELPKFSFSIKQSLGSAVKVHLIDPVFFLLLPQTNSDFILETALASQIYQSRQKDVFYFRDREEVDLIIQDEQNLIPIEIKNTQNVNPKELKGLVKFMEKYSVDCGFVFYTGEEKNIKFSSRLIKFIPAHKAAFFANSLHQL